MNENWVQLPLGLEVEKVEGVYALRCPICGFENSRGMTEDLADIMFEGHRKLTGHEMLKIFRR